MGVRSVHDGFETEGCVFAAMGLFGAALPVIAALAAATGLSICAKEESAPASSAAIERLAPKNVQPRKCLHFVILNKGFKAQAKTGDTATLDIIWPN
jgi:hypothetical protein